MEIRQRIAGILCLGIGLASSGLTVAQSSPGLGQEMSHVDREPLGLHDFDFLVGHWQVHHRKLKKRLVDSHDWIEFEGTLFSQPLMGGYANVDDTEGGKPVRLRFLWSQITPASCHWEQAESTDGGKTWETDWIQDLKRV